MKPVDRNEILDFVTYAEQRDDRRSRILAVKKLRRIHLSVQYLMFDTGGAVPAAIGADHPDLTLEAPLTPERQRALEEDLRD